MDPLAVAELLKDATGDAIAEMNAFAAKVLRTRGGRMGSGMGTLLEALWGYYVNQGLERRGAEVEIAWLIGHQYNDFACVYVGREWDPSTKEGELLRVEAKSMNVEADESKGHFEQLGGFIGENDLLVVLLWRWERVDESHVCPKVTDTFIGGAKEIARVRDALHEARGGTFVVAGGCPDGCAVDACPHVGEPLNAAGKRERLSGPDSTRPSARVAYAANFGGLVRMLKTNSSRAREALRVIRDQSDEAHAYITAIHRNFPDEEESQYVLEEWRLVAEELGIAAGGKSRRQLAREIRDKDPGYRERLRRLGRHGGAP